MTVCARRFPLPQPPLNINTPNRLFFRAGTHFFYVWVGELVVTPGVRCQWFLAKAPSQCGILFDFLSAPWFTARSVVLQSASIVCATALFLQPAQVCFASSFHANRRFVHASAFGVCVEANLPCFTLQTRLGIHKLDETKLGIVLQVHT